MSANNQMGQVSLVKALKFARTNPSQKNPKNVLLSTSPTSFDIKRARYSSFCGADISRSTLKGTEDSDDISKLNIVANSNCILG